MSHPSHCPKKERFSAINMRFRSTPVHKSAATVISAVIFLFLIHGAHCFDLPGAATEIFQKIGEERKISLAPHCGSNPPILDPESGVGHVEKLADFNSYVSGSPECKHAVLLASDVYGYEAPNLRKIADKVADAGFYAVVPDFFNGEPYDPNNPERPKDAWLKDHSPEKGFEDAKLMIDALKSKGFSSIGAAGFCWGAKAVVELTKAKLIQAAVILHPSYVTVDDIKSVKLPIAILGAELDHLASPAVLKQFDDILSANKVDRFVKVFPNCSHGWTLRYDINNSTAVARANEAHQDMLEWLLKYVK